MPQNQLAQLKAAGQKEKTLSDLETLERGETMWFMGLSLPSEKGTIALRTANCTMVFKEKDVLDVQKEGENFLVNIKVGNSIIARTETVMEARPTDCGCGDKEGIPGTIAQTHDEPSDDFTCLRIGWKTKCIESQSGGVVCYLEPYVRLGDCRKPINSGPRPIDAGPR